MGPLFLTLFFNILAFTTASVLDKRYVQGIHLVNCGNAYSAIVVSWFCSYDTIFLFQIRRLGINFEIVLRSRRQLSL
jgi:hypothetical protein